MKVIPRLESCGRTIDESIESSMEYRQRIPDRIDDPSVKKIIIMRWWEAAGTTHVQTEQLIRDNGLEAA